MNSGTSALQLTAVAKPRDLSRFDPRPRVRQAALEQPMPQTGTLPGSAVRERERTRAAARPAMRLQVHTVVLFAAALSLLLMIVYSYMQLSSLNSEQGAMEKELSALQKQENLLRKQYESAMDLRKIERFATEELGMVKPEASQIVYLNLAGRDHAEIIEQKTFWSSVKNLFSTVGVSIVEYLE